MIIPPVYGVLFIFSCPAVMGFYLFYHKLYAIATQMFLRVKFQLVALLDDAMARQRPWLPLGGKLS